MLHCIKSRADHLSDNVCHHLQEAVLGGGPSPLPENNLLEINTKETRTHRRITIKYGCPALPGASPKVKNEDDGELFAIFKKRQLVKTTTLSTQNNEPQQREKTKLAQNYPASQPTHPTHLQQQILRKQQLNPLKRKIIPLEARKPRKTILKTKTNLENPTRT